jgi:hypothetical protein
VEAAKVWVSLSYTREKNEFTWQSIHGYSYAPVALKRFPAWV